MPVATTPATPRWLLDISEATDVTLCGGKAAGLAKLTRTGWAVPPAICLSTEFYRRWLEASGLLPLVSAATAAARDAGARAAVLAELRARIDASALPPELDGALRDALGRLGAGAEGRLAVRSSGVDEDDGDASHAGVHVSLIVSGAAVGDAVKRCWASLWTETAWTYREHRGLAHRTAAMAVVVQWFVPAACSGVAFSVDPLTSAPTVVIEAAWGAGAALVGGQLTPDQYRVAFDGDGRGDVRRRQGRQSTMIAYDGDGETTVPLDDRRRGRAVLDDADILRLADAVKMVERAVGGPVDVEWVFDGATFWAVQARPITALPPRAAERRATVWTRANLKEVFPELPSPLALSYLALSLNRMFRSYHAANGYVLPDGAELVSVIHGRPYLNLSLMQDLAIERGGDPAVVGRLFGGGAAPSSPGPVADAARPKVSLAAGVRLAREMLATFFRTPARGRRLFRVMRAEAARLESVDLVTVDDATLTDHLARFGDTLLHERTLRRVHEVVSAQSRAYMVLEALLTAWLPADANGVLTRLMTGLGTLPNVRMTYRLMDLAAMAAADPRARAYFRGDLDARALRAWEDALAGTKVLSELRDFLREFGHRGPYESDVMSARFAEDPAPVLRLIQLHVRAGGTETAAAHAAARRGVRRATMAETRRTLRATSGRFGFGLRWMAFSFVCGALQRLLALRDECRHVTTMLVAHLRRVALEFGRRASAAGTLADPTDVFFLTWDELPRLLLDPREGWGARAAERRRQRARDAETVAPDLVSDDGRAGTPPAAGAEDGSELRGYGVSPGLVTGRVRVLHSVDAIGRLSGEIVVFPAIEPTVAPIFPLVRGFIAEMGGLLSHAAILAREYGVPAVVSVADATRRLHDGDRIELDGASGRIRVLERAS